MLRAVRTLDEQVPHGRLAHASDESHAAGQVALADHVLEVATLRAVAADEEAQVRVPPAELGDSRDLQVDALAVHQPAQQHHPARSRHMHGHGPPPPHRCGTTDEHRRGSWDAR